MRSSGTAHRRVLRRTPDRLRRSRTFPWRRTGTPATWPRALRWAANHRYASSRIRSTCPACWCRSYRTAGCLGYRRNFLRRHRRRLHSDFRSRYHRHPMQPDRRCRSLHHPPSYNPRVRPSKPDQQRRSLRPCDVQSNASSVGSREFGLHCVSSRFPFLSLLVRTSLRRAPPSVVGLRDADHILSVDPANAGSICVTTL